MIYFLLLHLFSFGNNYIAGLKASRYVNFKPMLFTIPQLPFNSQQSSYIKLHFFSLNECRKLFESCKGGKYFESKNIEGMKVYEGRKILKVMQGRQQKNFQGATEKTRLNNNTIKPPSTLSVPCIKIQGRARLSRSPLPTSMGVHVPCNLRFACFFNFFTVY